MKQIKVIVRDRNTLVLDEAAEKGDYISLSELNEVDYSEIESVIEQGKDSVYNKKLAEYRHTLDLENNEKINQNKNQYEKIISDLKHEIDLLGKEKESKLKEKENEIENKFKEEINKLSNKINELEKTKSSELEILKYKHVSEINALKSESEKTINDLNNQLKNIAIDTEHKIKEKEIVLTNEKMAAINKLKEEQAEVIRQKDNKINEILRQKAAFNVKQTGEDLEAWCNNEVISYMQNGLFNCTWQKDNEVVRDEDETKGSKADYVFKVYANSNHEDSELLTSVCLDMKDENPDSVNKKTNADYYKQLDKNRTKKNCKYAVLVSNLEMDKANDLPMFRVSEYKDMYVVRPAYLMIFLNMITSLTMRFVELILGEKEEKLALKNAYELNEEFESLKNTYLEKPLDSLRANVNEILSQSESIRKASNKITESCDKIINNYLGTIQSKLSNFELKINRGYKRFAKKENE